MRRFAPFVLLLACVVTTAAWADPPDPGMPGPGGPMGMRGGPGPGFGGQGPHGPGGPPFEKDLFPPDMVLRHQIAIGLSSEQLEAIKKLLNETHSRLLDVQTELERVTERLGKTIEPPRVDETAALAQADEAMALEARIKKTHLTLLVRVKNLLTEEQQGKLRDLRPSPPPPR